MGANSTIIICFIVAIFGGFFFLRPQKERYKPIDDYTTIFAIVNTIINKEIEFKVQDYQIRDVKIIYDFKEDLTDLTKSIMRSFSKDLIAQVEYYHDQAYLIKYVNRAVQRFLVEYTRENKPKTH